MMSDSQKPFVCTIAGCDMSFTNEDHLHCHHKKHDMFLNLGLINKSAEVADQTPTPTRFIRNCEEVGLFQDLQNVVNPFDETFKKAIESSKSGSLHVPEPSNDDTLHTPHIFPHVENNVNKYIDRSDNQSNHSNEFCIVNVQSIHDNAAVHDGICDEIDLTIIPDDEHVEKNKTSAVDLKNRLKEAIKNKERNGERPIVITPVPLDRLRSREDKELDKKRSNKNAKKQKLDGDRGDGKEKIREMNRAAQLRCRKRKQQQHKQMEEDLKELKNENSTLSMENKMFKHRFAALKDLVLKKRKSNSVQEGPLLAEIEAILNSSVQLPKKTKLIRPARTIPIVKHPPIKCSEGMTSIIPIPVVQPTGDIGQKPVLIQVMGSVAQLAVSLLPK